MSTSPESAIALPPARRDLLPELISCQSCIRDEAPRGGEPIRANIAEQQSCSHGHGPHSPLEPSIMDRTAALKSDLDRVPAVTRVVTDLLPRRTNSNCSPKQSLGPPGPAAGGMGCVGVRGGSGERTRKESQLQAQCMQLFGVEAPRGQMRTEQAQIGRCAGRPAGCKAAAIFHLKRRLIRAGLVEQTPG